MAADTLSEHSANSQRPKYILLGKRKVSNLASTDVAERYEKGATLRSLAGEFGHSQRTIRRYLVKLGFDIIDRRCSKKKPGERGYCRRCATPLMAWQQKIFCSTTCAALTQPPRPRHIFNCKSCGKPVHGGKHRKFCSLLCSIEARRKPIEHKRAVARLTSRLSFRNYCARLASATPPDADMTVIRRIFANCPIGYEVDHIIPVARGGLHHQDNLQYLPALANRSKGTRLPAECPEIMAFALPADRSPSSRTVLGSHRFSEAKSKSGDRLLITV